MNKPNQNILCAVIILVLFISGCDGNNTGPGINKLSAPKLCLPVNNTINVDIPPVLSWSPSEGAVSYILQVSANDTFTSFVFNESGLEDTSCQISGLNNSTNYFWRVRAENTNSTSDWSDIWNFSTGRACPGLPAITYENRTYHTVQIGNQCWLRENLDIGTMINGDSDQTDNVTGEKYCYNDEPAQCAYAGGLYQWKEALQYTTIEGAQGICPPGWHIPKYTEYLELSIWLEGDGNALKAFGQGTGGGAGTDTSGFSALLSGFRHLFGGFREMSYSVSFWCSTEYDTAYARSLTLYKDISSINMYFREKGYGFSVRCLKN